MEVRKRDTITNTVGPQLTLSIGSETLNATMYNEATFIIGSLI